MYSLWARLRSLRLFIFVTRSRRKYVILSRILFLSAKNISESARGLFLSQPYPGFAVVDYATFQRAFHQFLRSFFALRRSAFVESLPPQEDVRQRPKSFSCWSRSRLAMRRAILTWSGIFDMISSSSFNRQCPLKQSQRLQDAQEC